MIIIGQSIGTSEEITTAPAAAPPWSAVGPGYNPRIPAVRRPPRSATGASPKPVGTAPPEERSTSRAARTPLECGPTSAAPMVEVGEVWSSLPQDIPGRLRQRLLVMARRLQKVRLHFPKGGSQ